MFPAAQAFPHPPQFAASVCTSTQLPPQAARPSAQGFTTKLTVGETTVRAPPFTTATTTA